MVLRMYIDEVLIDEIPITTTANLASKEEALIENNLELIESYNTDPVFYVEGIPSKMN